MPTWDVHSDALPAPGVPGRNSVGEESTKRREGEREERKAEEGEAYAAPKQSWLQFGVVLPDCYSAT